MRGGRATREGRKGCEGAGVDLTIVRCAETGKDVEAHTLSQKIRREVGRVVFVAFEIEVTYLPLCLVCFAYAVGHAAAALAVDVSRWSRPEVWIGWIGWIG